MTVLSEQAPIEPWVDRFCDDLVALGVTAGFLTEDAPPDWRQRWADAYLLSLEKRARVEVGR